MNLGERVDSPATKSTRVNGTFRSPADDVRSVAPADIKASSCALDRPACWLAVVACAWATLKLESWDTLKPTNVADGIRDIAVGSMAAICVLVRVDRSLAVRPPIMVPTLEMTEVSQVSREPKAANACTMNCSI